MRSDIDIRILKSTEEMNEVMALEEEIWKGDTPVPVHQTVTAVKNGGIVAGAYDGGRLVGFSYGFPGFLNGKVYLCSHNLGIHPDYRNAGIGALLKERQRQEAIRLGYDLLTWTYDPLETRNGYLNLSKLHAICSTYIENCYGEIDDNMNGGLPTDRFKVEWWIDSTYVGEASPVAVSPDAHIIEWEKGEHGPKLTGVVPEEDYAQILVPVPGAFQEIKAADMALAVDWRMKTREVFRSLFRRGYAAVALAKSTDSPVHHYVLVKREETGIAAVFEG